MLAKKQTELNDIPSESERGLLSVEDPAPLVLLILPSPNHLRSFIADDPRHGVTHEEAGRRGGDAVVTKYGRDFYVAIGKKGGAATSNKLGHDHYEKIGRKGGATMKRKTEAGEGLSKEHYQAIGRKGGAIVREVFAEIRRKNAEEEAE